MPCVRYCYRQVDINRHCGSRSAVEMGGDMRDVGSHLGATAGPVSLRQGAVRAVGGGILVAKKKKKCETEMQETVRGEGRTGLRH